MVDEDELRDQIALLSRKLEVLEESISVLARPYQDVVEMVRSYKETAEGYARMLQLEDEGGAVGIGAPDVKDPVSREIISALLKRDDTITGLTETLRENLGKSDRKTVRKRVLGLMARGYVEKDEDRRYPHYRITPLVRRRWDRALQGGR